MAEQLQVADRPGLQFCLFQSRVKAVRAVDWTVLKTADIPGGWRLAGKLIERRVNYITRSVADTEY